MFILGYSIYGEKTPCEVINFVADMDFYMKVTIRTSQDIHGVSFLTLSSKPPDLTRGGRKKHVKSTPPDRRLSRLAEKSRLPVSEMPTKSNLDDTIKHLFFQCSFARSIWSVIQLDSILYPPCRIPIFWQLAT